MALVVKDRVRVTTTTTGTADFTLGGAVTGYQSFSVIGNGNQTYYAAQDPATGDWEVGIGTYSSTGPTLSRDTILESSNAGSKVVFAAGSKDLFCTYPAERAVYLDTAGSYPVQDTFNTLTATTASLTNGTILATPSADTDIANKLYVDTIAGTGIHIHNPVLVETPTALTASYTQGGTTPTWTTITNNKEIATGSAHGLSVNDVIVFGSTTNGLTAGYGYFVKSTPTTTSITLSLTYSGPEITSLTNGTGLSITSRANSGVGAKLTNSGTQAELAIDGITSATTPALQVGSRVLVYNQANAYENGIYTVTNMGSVSTNWELTRATTENTYGPKSTSSLGEGDYFFVQAGATGKGESYVLTTTGTIIFGTTNLTFTQFSEQTVYSAGTGLSLINDVFSITNTGVSATTYGSASTVPVIAVNAQGQITSATNTSIAITAGAVSGLAASATTDTTNAANISSGTLNSARLSGSYTGITGVGTLTAGTWNGSVIGATYGGTGLSSYAVGDLIYADTTTSLAKLADVATGNVLLSGGVGTAPAWGKVGLTTHVSGTLPVSNGGTGATTLTGYVKGNGTSAFTASATIPNSDTTATSANTANAIVARDASGNFSAGTITASLSGNATSATSATSATTATNLAGGVAGALPYQSASGTTLFTAAGTSGQYLQSNGTTAPTWITPPTIGNGTLTLAVSGTGLTGSASFTANQSGNTTFTVTSNATNANTASTIVARDASGNFSAGTITASLSGNATSATSATSAGSVTNSVTFNNGGLGDASGTTFNGSAARTISYNTVGASPLAGSASLTTTGTVTSGTWSASFGAVSGANLTNLTAGNLTGTIPSAVLGNSSLNVGTTSIALNRASANQALTGISSVTFPGATSGTIQLIPAATAGTGTVLTMPATTGTVITSGDTGTVTNTMLAGSIANNKLANSTISGVALGSNLGTLTLNTSGTGLSGSTTYNGSGAATFTVTSNATNANTASTIVARDASGNFSAGTITATLSGSATSATTATNLAGGAIGSLPYQSAAGTTLFVSGNTTTTPQFLTSTGTGVAAQAPTLTGSTGSGSVVLATSPALTTPNLGTPSAVTLTNGTGLPISTGVSGLGTGVATALAVNTGTAGAFVVNGGALGTPSSGTLTNATGLPISTGVSGLGTGVATALAVNTGTAGAFVVNGGALGTPSSGTLTNATGLPISSGVSGLGTGVATALAVNTGSSGAFVVNGGALGTPSSGTVTNLTGTASININGTVGATTPTTGNFTAVTSTSEVVTGAAGILTRAAATQDGVELIGRAGGTLSYKISLTPTTLSASRTLTLPDNSGTVLTTGATVTVAQGGTGLTSGTSGGIPYFSSTSAMASSALLAANALMIGGGAGAAPATTTTGTGVITAVGNAVNTTGGLVTQSGTLAASALLVGGGASTAISSTTTGTGVVSALGVNVGTSGAFVVNGGALGTPSSGTVTNLTGTASININGTVGATTPNTGAFTTLSATDTVVFSAINSNIAIGTSQLGGSLTLGGSSQTGSFAIGPSTKNFTINIGAGITESALTKVINIGTLGGTGSTTNITLGTSVSGATSTITLNTSSTVTVQSVDAGATAGPILSLYRNSASPAASDVIGQVLFQGKDSATNDQTYAYIQSGIESPTSTTESGNLQFFTTNSGTTAERVRIAATGDTTFYSTGQIQVPSGTTAQRSGSPSNGMFRYNTSLNQLEGYVNGVWSGVANAQASGAIITNKTTISVNYTIASGENGMSVGAVTINSGVTVTVSSGQRWLIL